MIADLPASPSMRRVALLGEAMVEISSLDFIRGTARVGVAGDVFNTAVYLVRAQNLAGWPCDFFTVVGLDALSDEIVAAVAREGIGTGQIGRTAQRGPGLYAVHLDGRGERRFQYWRDRSAARLLFSAGPPDLAALRRYPVVYLSAITLAILPPDTRRALIEACTALKAAGHWIVFDSNYRAQLWSNADEARETIAQMWAATSLGLPSHDDECALFPNETAAQTLQRIAAHGVAEIALKRSAAGPLLWDGKRIVEDRYASAPRIVDTTAAGDSFNAGYLARRLAGGTMAEAAQSGHALAIDVIAQPGAIVPLHPPIAGNASKG